MTCNNNQGENRGSDTVIFKSSIQFSTILVIKKYLRALSKSNALQLQIVQRNKVYLINKTNVSRFDFGDL